MTGRDSSRGACAQPCRYQYALMEEKRPGEYFPIEEDEQGTYILNSRDMCMIDHLRDLTEAGLSSLKIEGRAKSAYYAAIVTGAYRHGLDAVAAGEEIDPVWRDEVEHVSHRPYSTGFYYGPPGQYYANSRHVREWQVVALVMNCDAEGNATLSLRNKFRTGDTVELVGPDLRPFAMTVGQMQDESGAVLEEPRTPPDDIPYEIAEGRTALYAGAACGGTISEVRRRSDERRCCHCGSRSCRYLHSPGDDSKGKPSEIVMVEKGQAVENRHCPRIRPTSA